MSGFDQEILQDFLTESGELLDQLDKDLVVLEETPPPRDPELLNRVFRALHTIKGSASFLALTNLVDLAHAAESALNAARNGQVTVGREMMDLLLAAVDVLKKQFVDLTAGRELTKADDALVSQLAAIGEGRSPATVATSVQAQAPKAVMPSEPPIDPPTPPVMQTPAAACSRRPLKLPENKLSLMEFLVDDLRETLARGVASVEAFADPARRASGAAQLADLGETLSKSAIFFEFPVMEALGQSIIAVGSKGARVSDETLAQVTPRVQAVLALLQEQVDGLAEGQVVSRKVDELCESITSVLNETLASERVLPAGASAAHALVVDGVLADENDIPHAGATPVLRFESALQQPAAAHAVEQAADSEASKNERAAASPGAAAVATAVEQTIRVEVGRLESLLNLVGELVLQKNRLAAIARKAAAQSVGTQDFRDTFGQAAGSLDRVTGDIQVAVMRTRMQPLDKLFGKYPRLLRDLARKTGKQMHMVIEGGDTEVDKSVIEELGDPLVHLIRNSADHGIELPADRRAAGKPELGTITLTASHEGGHVQILIRDDGRGLSRAKIGAKAMQRGLVTEAELAKMSDSDVQKFIFAAGFSTAEQVTDLSGRGVGMDVVRANIEKIKGTIDLISTEGKGTTIAIKIPLTVAILTAMMVEIGTEIYAVPLASITEIVKPAGESLSTIQGHRVLRLRDTVLPLLNGCDVFHLPERKRRAAPFVVVVATGTRRAGLLVSRLIGQQEVVVKPLAGMVEETGPVSGATVRDDGGVSLIVDVPAMVRLAEGAAGVAGAKRSKSEPAAGPGPKSGVGRREPLAASAT